MSKTRCRWSFVVLLLAALLLISACGGGNAPPTPAGQADGRPTLIYLWNFP
jgi:ABC-type glycerol-3-phosphate transport system substrate-binding protein